MADIKTETKKVVEIQQPSTQPDLVVRFIEKVDAGSTAIVFVAAAILWLTRGQLKKIVDAYCETSREMTATLRELKQWGVEEQEYRHRTESLLKDNSAKIDDIHDKLRRKHWFK